jgi:hypothetical protein
VPWGHLSPCSCNVIEHLSRELEGDANGIVVSSLNGVDISVGTGACSSLLPQHTLVPANTGRIENTGLGFWGTCPAHAGIPQLHVTNAPDKLALAMPQRGGGAQELVLCALAALYQLICWSRARTWRLAPLGRAMKDRCISAWGQLAVARRRPRARC